MSVTGLGTTRKGSRLPVLPILSAGFLIASLILFAVELGRFAQGRDLIQTDISVAGVPWALVVSAGVMQGYLDLADAYDVAAKANRANPMPFNKEASTLRSLAGATGLEFAQTVHQFQEKNKDASVLLAFEYPTAGAAAPPPAIDKIKSGVLIQDSEREALKKAMVQRGVLLALCRAAGSPGDPAKTQETMKAPEVRVPRGQPQRCLVLVELVGVRDEDRDRAVRLGCRDREEVVGR